MAVIDVSGSRVKIVLARFAFSHFGFSASSLLRSFRSAGQLIAWPAGCRQAVDKAGSCQHGCDAAPQPSASARRRGCRSAGAAPAQEQLPAGGGPGPAMHGTLPRPHTPRPRQRCTAATDSSVQLSHIWQTALPSRGWRRSPGADLFLDCGRPARTCAASAPTPLIGPAHRPRSSAPACLAPPRPAHLHAGPRRARCGLGVHLRADRAWLPMRWHPRAQPRGAAAGLGAHPPAWFSGDDVADDRLSIS